MSITSKKLIVNIVNINNKNHTDYFFAYEFSNGAIMVLGETTNDWFFDSVDDLEPCGYLDKIVSIERTEETVEWTQDYLKQSIRNSEKEFECDTGKIKELVQH